MRTDLVHTGSGIFGILLSLAFVSAVFGAEVDCLKCHAKLKGGKVLHAAVDMGCATCHGGIDASKVPHKKTNQAAKGLNSDQPDLCYGCHDKKAFEKKNLHAAVGMGCTSCHDPHSSGNAKLLKAEAPGLCYNCHDKKPFTAKTVHAPVAGGMCLSCHSPHASDQIALLLKKPYDTCIECHAEVLKRPHILASSERTPTGHPLSPDKKDVVIKERKKESVSIVRKDPAKPGRQFYCGSCHDPHSTAGPLLFKFNAQMKMELCGHCHKF